MSFMGHSLWHLVTHISTSVREGKAELQFISVHVDSFTLESRGLKGGRGDRSDTEN